MPGITPNMAKVLRAVYDLTETQPGCTATEVRHVVDTMLPQDVYKNLQKLIDRMLLSRREVDDLMPSRERYLFSLYLNREAILAVLEHMGV